MAEELKPCPFCNLLQEVKEIDDFYKKTENVYKTALVNETYCNDEYAGKVTYYGFKLNFCPVCGKELNHKE